MYIPTIIEASFNPQPNKILVAEIPLLVVPGPFAAPGSSGPDLPPPEAAKLVSSPWKIGMLTWSKNGD